MQHESSHTKKRYIQRPGEVEECMDLPLPFRMQLMYHIIGNPGVLKNPVRSWCALCDPPPPPLLPQSLLENLVCRRSATLKE